MLPVRYLALMTTMVVLPSLVVEMAAQAGSPIVTVPVAAGLGIGAFLATKALAIATILGAVIVAALSHFWPAFNDISQNPDGTPSFVGTWIKRGTAFLATWIVVVGLRKLGADAPAEMVAEIGLFWTQFLEALAGAVTSGVVFKIATTSPKKG
jgi:hypothetical protein